jgi:hypothetical protein
LATILEARLRRRHIGLGGDERRLERASRILGRRTLGDERLVGVVVGLRLVEPGLGLRQCGLRLGHRGLARLGIERAQQVARLDRLALGHVDGGHGPRGFRRGGHGRLGLGLAADRDLDRHRDRRIGLDLDRTHGRGRALRLGLSLGDRQLRVGLIDLILLRLRAGRMSRLRVEQGDHRLFTIAGAVAALDQRAGTQPERDQDNNNEGGAPRKQCAHDRIPYSAASVAAESCRAIAMSSPMWASM